jgi:hypothetical protein
MTCHVCAKPNCVDDCTNFPPPPLKIGSAEHKLQELLKITNEMANEYVTYNGDHDLVCVFCDTNVRVTFHGLITNHNTNCPILKLEQFKASIS